MTKGIYMTVTATCQFFPKSSSTMWAVQLWEAAAIVSHPSICLWWWILQVIYSDWFFLAGFLMKKHHNASHFILILLRLQSVAIWVAARIMKSLLWVHTGFKFSKIETFMQKKTPKHVNLSTFFIRLHIHKTILRDMLLNLWNQTHTHSTLQDMALKRGCLSLMCLCREVGRWEGGMEGEEEKMHK